MFRQILTSLGILLTAVLYAETAHAVATKTITLNNSTNQAIIEDDGIPLNRLVRIRSLNSSFATITFELPTSELITNLGGGNDTLEFDGTNITSFTAKLTINGAVQKSIFQDYFEGDTDTRFFFVTVVNSVELDYGLAFDQTLLANLNSGIVNIRNGDGGSKVSA